MEESEIKILRYLNLWPKIGRENEKPFTIITVTSLILYYWLPIGCLLHLTHSIIEGRFICKINNFNITHFNYLQMELIT